MDDPTTTRRRLLEGASVGGGALLAGCTDQLDLGGGSGSDDAAQTDAAVDGVGAIATVDQEALQEEQLAIREELRTGNISREEAQQQASELREEFIGEAVSGLAETAAATDGVDVASEYASLGAVVVTGEAAPIIGLLNSEDVRALVPRSDVEDQAGTETTTESA